MNPISDGGLVPSTAQLITFSNDLISKSREIYRSADSSFVRYEEHEGIARTLHIQSRRIRAQAQLCKRNDPAQVVKGLCKKCAGAREASGSLTRTIESPKVEDSPKIRKSFRQALKTVWMERDKEDLLQ